MPQLSPDGYIRITEQDLAVVELHHLESSLYPPEDTYKTTDSITDIPQESLIRLSNWLNTLNWQSLLLDYIRSKYT